VNRALVDGADSACNNKQVCGIPEQSFPTCRPQVSPRLYGSFSAATGRLSERLSPPPSRSRRVGVGEHQPSLSEAESGCADRLRKNRARKNMRWAPVLTDGVGHGMVHSGDTRVGITQRRRIASQLDGEP
jgi:hypothetical protein